MLEILLQQQQIITEGIPKYRDYAGYWGVVLEGVEKQIELLTLKQAA